MNQGLEQSFLSLVEGHKGIIYKVTYAYSKSSDDRKDLFQEIMVNLWKAYPSFKGNSKVSTWIYKIALYTAITNYRNEKKQIKYEQIHQDFQQNVSESFKDDPQERVKFLYQAIAKLSSVDKAIILLLLDEKSYKEIAEIIGLKPATVGMRINRAKDKLSLLLTSIKV
jgi:RNA polymerase sigma-70 factor, ECF subfamily